MPGAAMALLAARLSRAGYEPHVFPYRGRSPFRANCERFARFVQRTLRGRSAHFIGHSLGGLLVLEMLNAHAEIPVSSAVLLGAPARGCLAGRRFGTGPLGRWMMGACGDLWLEHEAAWSREAPLGVIAGTLPIGLGRAFGRLAGPNDGVVRVEETAVRGMTAQALVPTGHSLLILSSSVETLVERFMATGRFE
jgi:pimeloyl-ACP methyl ester carboxylesterase